MADIKPPSGILGNINSIKKVISPATINAGPPAQYTAASLAYTTTEWIKKCPKISSIDKNITYNITYEWWGVGQASTVIYNGTWDPQK